MVPPIRGEPVGFEPQLRQDQKCSVDVRRAVAADVGAPLRIEPTRGDLLAELFSRCRPPACASSRGAVVLGDAQCAVQGEPGHQLGVHVVGRVRTHLPDAGVRLAPSGRDRVGESRHRPPRLGVQPVSGMGEEPRGVEDPAVTVELVLVGGAVALPDRDAVGVAWPVLQLALWCWVLSVQGQQNRQAWTIEARGAEQPGQEGPGLLMFADAQEGSDADAGVARPGVAVVPVPNSAEDLWQRGGGGGNRRPRRRVGQQAQGQQAANHRVALGNRRVDVATPGPPAQFVAVGARPRRHLGRRR